MLSILSSTPGVSVPASWRVSRGEDILRAGVSGHAWQIVHGTVRLSRRNQGGPVSTWLAVAGDVLGAEVLLRGSYGCSATALTGCLLRPWSWGDGQVSQDALLDAFVRAEGRIADAISLRLGSANDRVLRFLQMLGPPPVELPTLQDIGEITGLNLATVSRTITGLTKAGSLSLKGRQRSYWVMSAAPVQPTLSDSTRQVA